MPTALELFRGLVPSLCEETDARVGLFLDAAARRLDASAWGAVYPDALVYMAAHLLTLSPGPDTTAAASAGGGAAGAIAGPITKKKAGDLEVSFGTSGGTSGGGGGGSTSNTDNDLTTTHWGRQFLALRDTRAAGAPTFIGVF